MSELKISLAQVTECAQELRRLNTSIDNVLTSAKEEMRALSAIWQSDGSEMIRQRFEHFSKKFTEEKETIERCLPIRKHRGAREKRYSFGYAVFLILALMK